MAQGAEDARKAALLGLEILDSPPESEFDDLAEFAALTFKAPVALISLIDSDRQWFKARFGLDLVETPRAIALCDHAIRTDQVMVVPDAAADHRFSDNPLVTGAPGIRFYAGAPLTMPDGHRVGTLCVIDFEPRTTFTAENEKRLQALGASVMQVLLQRAAARKAGRLAEAAAAKSELLGLAEQAAGVGTWVLDVATERLTWSNATYQIFGLDPADGPPDRDTLLARYHPEDATRLTQLLEQAIASGQGYEHQAQITRPDGAVRHIASRGICRCDETGAVVAFYGTVQDVTGIKLADAALRDSEMRLRTLNWALTAFAKSSSALLHGANLEGVVKNVCEAIVEDDAYCLASVALAEPLPSKWLNFVAGAGPALGYLEGLRLSWDENQIEGTGPTGQSIRNGAPWIMRDSLVDPIFTPWREKGQKFGIRSSLTVPFSNGGDVLGVLIVYASRPNAFGPQEMGVFQRLGEELAFSIALDEGRARLAASQQAQRQAEEAEAEALRRLTESEARFRMLAENVPDLIVRYDLEGVIEYVSPSIRQFGAEPESLVGRKISEITPAGATQASALKALREGRPLPSGRMNEQRLVLRDGREVWLQGNPAEILDEAGKVIAVVTVMRDVTERHAMEAELRHKRAEAEQAAVVKAQFLANMSHEIRNPLTAVIGFAGLLERIEPLPDKAKVYIERIKAGGAALLAVVNQVLDFSRLEAGKIELHPQSCDLAQFLDETVAMTIDEAIRKGLTLRFEKLSALPSSVSLDSNRLQQVLLNLLGNAIKFTSEGEVVLTARHESAGGGTLRVEVTDTGSGIAPEQAHLLFQRFSQIDGSNTREFGGVGLGLAISKGLVELMGGEIGLEPAEGGGSRFWFTVRAPADADSDVESPMAEAAASVSALSILVVDDVAVNRELLAGLLTPFDVHLIQAADGAQAVDIASREAFDLILMDLQMPVMDGLAATRAIRVGAGPNATTPILAVSANVMAPQVEACLKAGMNDHVGKPINTAELLNKIAFWTDERRAQMSA